MTWKLSKRHWSFILLLVVAIILYFILPVSIPLVIALITALILNPLVIMLQNRTKINRNIAVFLVFMLFLIFIGLAGTFLVTKAIGQVINFVEDLPSHIAQLNIIYSQLEADFNQYSQSLPREFIEQLSDSIEGYFNDFTNVAKEKISLTKIADIVSKIPQYLISFIVYLIALFLFMLELPVLKTKIYNMLEVETANKVSFMGKRLSNVLFGFFKAQFLVSTIIFIVSFISLLIIAPDVAVVMSLIIWAIDFIPIIGSIAILAPWALYVFLIGNTAFAIKLSILAIILLAIRRIIEPKLMGQHIGLSPLATLIAMFLGLKLLGILGFIIGPLLVITFTSAKEAGIIKWDIKI